MRQVNSFEEVRELIAEHDPLYIRYTSNIRYDLGRGYSTNYASGQSEAGLSVNNLVDSWGGSDDDFLAQQMGEYQLIIGGNAYLLAGTKLAGKGSDGEPLLEAVTVIAQPSKGLLTLAAAMYGAQTEAQFRAAYHSQPRYSTKGRPWTN